ETRRSREEGGPGGEEERDDAGVCTHPGDYKPAKIGKGIRADGIKGEVLVPLLQVVQRLTQVGPLHHLREPPQHPDLALLQLVPQPGWQLRVSLKTPRGIPTG